MVLLLLLPLLGLTPSALARGRAEATDTPVSAVPADITALQRQESASGLAWYVIRAGTGTAAAAGDGVVVQYTGWLADGTRFDSSRDRRKPFTFNLGAGEVIKGWDEGVVGMQPGEIRQLLVPASLGYGVAGAGGVIPANAALIFEIELIRVRYP